MIKKNNYHLSDFIIIAVTAALGLAVKAVITPLVHVLTGALMIPGGAVAGGFYMLFIVLAEGITGKRGAAVLTAVLQAVLVTVTGAIGSHGALSLITYTLPGIACELVFLISRHKGCCALCCFFGGMLANVAGSFAVNVALFDLSAVPLLIALCSAALSGGLGGLIANALASRIRALGILRE